MKLVDALANGLFLGLDTTEEAIMDVAIHAGNYFTYDKMHEEFHEIITELSALPNADTFMKRTEDNKIELLPNVLIKDYFPEAVTKADELWAGYDASFQ